MAQGLDYSFSHPDEACVARVGYSFVARYVGDPDPNTAKYLDAPELALIRSAGLSVVAARETAAGFMLTDSGAAHARASRAHCDQLGLFGIPIFYALDVDPRPLSAVEVAAMVQLGAIPRGLSDEKRADVVGVLDRVDQGDEIAMMVEIIDFMGPAADAVTRFLQDAAAADGGGHNVGIYGGKAAIDRWARQPFCWWGWQTYAWSGGLISGNAHFRQYLNGQNVCGGTVDLNETYTADFGQWPRPQGDDMTPEEHEALFACRNALLGTGDRIGDLWNRDGLILADTQAVRANLLGTTGDRLGDIWVKLEEILADDDVDNGEVARQVLAVLTPEAITAAIPTNIAVEVVTRVLDTLPPAVAAELHARLAG